MEDNLRQASLFVQGGTALRETMRSWGVNTPEDLAGWIRRRGFTTVAPGGHIAARAQKFILSEAGAVDVRVCLLEEVSSPFGSCQWGCTSGETNRDSQKEPEMHCSHRGGRKELGTIGPHQSPGDLLEKMSNVEVVPSILEGYVAGVLQ